MKIYNLTIKYAESAFPFGNRRYADVDDSM